MIGKKSKNHIRLSEGQKIGLAGFLIIAATALAYRHVLHYDFVFDDFLHIVLNQRLHSGLNWENVTWAFTTNYAANWYPLVWLSHLFDIQLFGLDPGWHHFTSLILHLANSFLLLFLLKKMTGDLWPSSLVAALFALHPLHVESVAWISQKKDLISTLFWLLTMWAYWRYVRVPALKNYLLIIVFFILGLMSKAMLVTLPFALLLLDYWPLQRFSLISSDGGQARLDRHVMLTLLKEKIVLFLLIIPSGIITFMAQDQSHAVTGLELISPASRLANSFQAYTEYLWLTVWPKNLSVFYPHQMKVEWLQAAAAGLLILLPTILILKRIVKQPFLFVGWFWFLGTLVPVIGLIQVGGQAMADRYTYIPLIGIFIMAAWGVQWLDYRHNFGVPLFRIMAVLLLIPLAIATGRQVTVWQNQITLFKNAALVDPDNWLAHYNLAVEYAKLGQIPEAMDHYRELLRVRPQNSSAHNNMGLIYFKQGRLDEAEDRFKLAIRYNPDKANAYNNLGLVYMRLKRPGEAAVQFEQSFKKDPSDPGILTNLAGAYIAADKYDEAIAVYKRMLQMFYPNNPMLHYEIARLYAQMNNRAEAYRWLDQAVEKGFNRWTRLRADKDWDRFRQDPTFEKLLERTD